MKLNNDMHYVRTTLLLSLTLMCVNVPAYTVRAQVMESTNYQIESDSVNAGGGYGESSNYRLESTTGEAGTGFSQSGNYIVSAGYLQSATSTGDSQTPQTPSTPTGGGGIVGSLVALHVVPGTHHAGISWETTVPTQFVLSWGETTAYEMGTIAGTTFSRVHGTDIRGLTPGTRYEFIVSMIDQYGNRRVLARSFFTTLTSPDVSAPANVRSFFATVETTDDVRLRWQNPLDTDFSRVRIVRSYDFYPSDSSGGEIIYEGDRTSFLDEDALSLYKRAYYTAFTIDTNGNISSGAIAQAARLDAPPEERGPATSTIELAYEDIIFIQNGELVPRTPGDRGENIFLDSTQPFVVAIPYDAVLENLKTIIVTLAHPEDDTQVFSFLLKINEDKTAYEAYIAPLVYGGEYVTDVTLIDYALKQAATVSLVIVASALSNVEQGESSDLSFYQIFWISLILLLLLFLLVWSVRKIQRTRVVTNIPPYE